MRTGVPRGTRIRPPPLITLPLATRMAIVWTTGDEDTADGLGRTEVFMDSAGGVIVGAAAGESSVPQPLTTAAPDSAARTCTWSRRDAVTITERYRRGDLLAQPRIRHTLKA